MSTNVEELNGLYPMRVVTRLTGLSADTIRVWERRYQAVKPERTEGNKRRYSGSQVRRLSQLRRATELGHTISEVANLEEERLQEIIVSTDAPALKRELHGYEGIIDDYLSAIEQFEVQRADEILTRTAAILPPLALSLQFIVPLTNRVGELWCGGNFAIAHEHIVTGQIRSLLGSLIRSVTPPKGASRVVVATPAGHRHEFGAFIGSFIAASRGMEPLYLGADVPVDQIELAGDRSGARVVLLSIARDCSEAELKRLTADTQRLAERFDIWLGLPEGHAAGELDLPVLCFHRYEDLDAALVHRTS